MHVPKEPSNPCSHKRQEQPTDKIQLREDNPVPAGQISLNLQVLELLPDLQRDPSVPAEALTAQPAPP